MILPTPNEALYEENWRLITPNIVPDILPHYYISTYGRIYNSYTKNYLPKNIEYCKDKYISTSLSQYGNTSICIQIHRVELMVFGYVEGCENLEVNHKDGVKYHNWLWNLEWATHKENINHAIQSGLLGLGESRGNSQLTNEQAMRVCELISLGKSPTEIQDIMDIHNVNMRKIVENIKLGLSWSHISKNYDFSKAFKKNNFSDDQIHKICKLFEDRGTKISYKQVLDYIGYDYSYATNKELDRLNASICGIRSKKTFKSICNQYNYSND